MKYIERAIPIQSLAKKSHCSYWAPDKRVSHNY